MSLTAYNNVPLPQFLYGTAWKKEATKELTMMAVESGFRGIDTANQLKHYDENRVGEALLELRKGGISRDMLFLQTKFTSIDGQDRRLPYDPSAKTAAQVQQSIDSSLLHLHTDYVDSYVLHGPTGRYGLTQEDWEAWAAIEEIYKQGKARIIGVSNFSAEQLSLLCSKAALVPMVVQNRCYAVTGWDEAVRKICTNQGSVYQGFSLLTANARELSQEHILAIAGRLDATLPQLVFSFALATGILPLTGTTSRRHMKEDLLSEQFQLSEQDIKTIAGIGTKY